MSTDVADEQPTTEALESTMNFQISRARNDPVPVRDQTEFFFSDSNVKCGVNYRRALRTNEEALYPARRS